MILKVPSAPMHSLVRSNPAADLRDLHLVLMISPEGRTTVYEVKGWACASGNDGRKLVISTDGVEESFTLPQFHVEQRWL